MLEPGYGPRLIASITLQDVCATAQRLTSKSANIRAARAGIEEEGRQRALAALRKRVYDTENLANELKMRIAQVTTAQCTASLR